MRDHRRRNEKNRSFSLWDNLRYCTKTYWTVRKSVLMLIVCGIPVNTIIRLLGILLPKLVLDALSQANGYYPLLWQISGCTILLIAAQIGNNLSQSKSMLGSMYINTFHFRRCVDDKAMDMDYEAFSSPKGKILFDKARQSIRGGFGHMLSGFLPAFTDLFGNLLGFLSFCAIIAVLNPWIILLLTLSYCIDGVLMLRIEKWIQKTKNERSGIFRKLRYIAYSTRGSDVAKDIRIYSMSGWLRELGQLFNGENTKWEYAVMKRRLAVLLFEGLLIFLRDGAAYIYLIYRVLKGHGGNAVSIGDFMLYFGAIAGFGEWLGDMVSNGEKVMETHYALSDFRNFVQLPDGMNREPKTPLPAGERPLSIQLSHISYQYPESEKLILDDICVDIAPGEKIAVVGVNGAGKTTLVKLLCGLLKPTQGEIAVDGVLVQDYGRDAYYQLFTAVFQDISLLPTSIAKNIAFQDEKQIDMQRLRYCLKLAGLLEKAESLPKGLETDMVANVLQDAVTLSGGEMQRLLLARAVYESAPIMILDEPTAALDPIAENEIYLKYNEITKGKTAIYISHRLSSTRFCDRILLLDGAKIAEQGTHEQLMAKNGKYAHLFAVQSHYYQETLEKEAAAL